MMTTVLQLLVCSWCRVKTLKKNLNFFKTLAACWAWLRLLENSKRPPAAQNMSCQDKISNPAKIIPNDSTCNAWGGGEGGVTLQRGAGFAFLTGTQNTGLKSNTCPTALLACLLVCVFKVSIVSTFIFSVHQRQASGLLLAGLDPYFPWEDVALGTN